MRRVAVISIIVILAALLAGCAGGEETRVTPVDESPPVISGVSASDITETSVTVTWTTDEPSTSEVTYWRTDIHPLAFYPPVSDENLVTSHSIDLSELQPNTAYHFRVESKDASGNEATSEDDIFTTLPPMDTTAPVISNVTVTDITETTARITWSTDEPATSGVRFWTERIWLATCSDVTLVIDHSVSLSGLDPDTTYHYCVTSRDAGGNKATSEDDTFTTLPPPPTNVQITHIFYDGLVYRVESDEYVEVTNLGDAPQDLEGWVLRDISEGYPSFTFPSYILAPGASIRVYTNEIHPEWGSFSFRYGKAIWNNSDPDIAALYDAYGREVSRKSY